MSLILNSLIPDLFSVVFIWFLIAVVISIVRLIGTNKIVDPAAKKLEKKKAWRIAIYPILVFVIVAILQSVLHIISR